ncbi:ABA4-like family protein [Altererythrobacter sp. ZODW24]|uniref:ABA4-like family protein n=1 Tax=Altererythrobacter sp. ZODW24 TaxID=2185142 RepID=UPI000DF74451|nr:ABA4-like family protein [Altererythrobacter sp. ZODW24]
MWAGLFSFVNILAMIAWAALILAPRSALLNTVILYLGVGILCLVYAVFISLLLSGMVDGAQVAGTQTAGMDFRSIEGVRSIFMSDGGVLIGWTHYLAFDLFVGLWVSKDADAKGVSRFVQAPILFFTFMFGPVGLLAWLIYRERFRKKRT